MIAKNKKIVKNVINYVFLTILAMFFLFPLFIMFTRSLMTDDEILFAIQIMPKGLNFATYAQAFNPKITRWMLNTLVIIGFNFIGVPLSASLCAYGFSKMKFLGQNFFFAFMLTTLMLPSIAMQIPLYILYSNMGWIGTWLPMIVPGFFGGGATTIFLIRQFMKNIPNQLSEAARIDGANSFIIYLRMVLPLSMPIIAFTMLNVFLGNWNDFMTPLMYLQNYERMFTLSLGIYMQFKGGGLSLVSLPNVQMATGILMIIPCMILFFIFQKQLIEGVSTSGLKG